MREANVRDLRTRTTHEKMKKPFYQTENATLFCGDCIDVMQSMPSCSIDTIITDPPYHLTQPSKRATSRERAIRRGFMGKTWDGGAIAFDPELWATALRVAKPGATLLAFGGTRTFHRLACAIEDSGWELRDCLMWLYGSGFPKSLDVSKAIDQSRGARRVVINSEPMKRMASPKGHPNSGYVLKQPQVIYERTAPACDDARLWNGWGTGLKPAWEPVIVAMKPRDGTFARNAIRHGVAGFNIDGGRIRTVPGNGVWGSSNAACHEGRKFNSSPSGGDFRSQQSPRGRWPANLVLTHQPDCRLLGTKRVKGSVSTTVFHDAYDGKSATGFLRGVSHPGNQHADSRGMESVEAWQCQPDCPVRLLDEQSGPRSAGGNLRGTEPSRPFETCYGEMKGRRTWTSYADTGGASRFFYCAKASQKERNAGLPPGMANNHPTVKPLKLMEYLCRLTATPTGGIVLDPFAGTGSTLVAASNVGRRAIGIEIDRASLEIAKERLG